jgi:hypothetical protein
MKARYAVRISSRLAKGITLLTARTQENVTEAITADPMKKALV